MDKNVDLISLIWFFYSTLIVLTYPWLSPNNYCFFFLFVCFLNLASTLMSWQIRNKALLSLKCDSHWPVSVSYRFSKLLADRNGLRFAKSRCVAANLFKFRYVRACVSTETTLHGLFKMGLPSIHLTLFSLKVTGKSRANDWRRNATVSEKIC